MSVAPLHKSELENIAGSLHKHLKNSDFQTWEGYKIEDAYRAIAVAGIANKTAAFLTYGSGDGWDDTRDLNEVPGTLTAQETYKRIGNMLYNCVSNDGTDCMPEKYREILEQMRQSIIEKATGW